MSPAVAARILSATAHPGGSWWTDIPCPRCQSVSVALTHRGWECRFDGCRLKGTDPRRLVAGWLAVRGADLKTIVRVLERAA